ncbi:MULTISPECIES: cupin domain-containing protein [Brevibacillus]|uniref:cupin domain-containing protein n=1 Tax=Brevibacillus TaxID=55080 RepID=UPI00156B349B|nr:MULTISPECIES: cupin domain-containing protein [Brevibacillus]NRQ55989.1 cupin domain-containing protein [Brevibacillus sp. HD1.4A]WDV94844.1 cupin domain-containing protein [Brevibacillus parabrevis]
MLIVNANAIQPEDRPGVTLKILFTEDQVENGKATFGVVVVPPGARIPLSGSGSHAQDEYSIVVKGTILAGTEEGEYRMSANDASLIPAGEAHWAYNDGSEDCEIVWVLVKR